MPLVKSHYDPAYMNSVAALFARAQTKSVGSPIPAKLNSLQRRICCKYAVENEHCLHLKPKVIGPILTAQIEVLCFLKNI